MGVANGGSPYYLTPLEAAKVLKVDRRTIYRWLRSGEIDARKIGGTWRIMQPIMDARNSETIANRAARATFRGSIGT